MSISYEEALTTLQSMFSAPWTVGTLDAVLRHHKGHMENTVDMILTHGDKDPALLMQRINSGPTPTGLVDQLADQLSQGASMNPASAKPPAKKGRGIPTTLPDDFLRIPSSIMGQTNNNTDTSNNNTLDSDAALARMLQDELFSQELARNPDFAHLARGRPRTTGGVPVGSERQSAPPRRPYDQQQQPPPMQMSDIMGKISELGQSARFRLNKMAAQFKAGNENPNETVDNNRGEFRGLLSNASEEDEGMELAARKAL